MNMKFALNGWGKPIHEYIYGWLDVRRAVNGIVRVSALTLEKRQLAIRPNEISELDRRRITGGGLVALLNSDFDRTRAGRSTGRLLGGVYYGRIVNPADEALITAWFEEREREIKNITESVRRGELDSESAFAAMDKLMLNRTI